MTGNWELADLMILSENPLAILTEQIDGLKVLETIKEGPSIYKRTRDDPALPRSDELTGR